MCLLFIDKFILRQVFEYNNKIYSILCEENKRLERIIALRQSAKTIKTISEICEVKTQTQDIISMNVDVDIYLGRIKECTTLEGLISILPDKNSENFYHIVYTILLKLYEEVMAIKKLLLQEKDTVDPDTEQYFRNEIENTMFKIQYIKRFVKANNRREEPVQCKNELIFLKTNYGNVCALSDIKDIAMEYYDQFYELLESICDGTFKNFKTFTGNNNLKGLSEVRGDQVRIIFDRISTNVYVIICILVKKADKTASYQALLHNRNDLYKASYEEMQSLVETSEEYLEENRRIKAKLYGILTKDNKVKKLGEIHG